MTSTTIDEFRRQILLRAPLRIRGGGSKDFYGGAPNGQLESNLLDTRAHSGIVSSDPSELVVTVKAGTTLQELELVLAARRSDRGRQSYQFVVHVRAHQSPLALNAALASASVSMV